MIKEDALAHLQPQVLKRTSFEPDSNQWPMDRRKLFLQSTALPTELSKV